MPLNFLRISASAAGCSRIPGGGGVSDVRASGRGGIAGQCARPQLDLRLLARGRAAQPVRREPAGDLLRVGAHGHHIRPEREDAAAAPGALQRHQLRVRHRRRGARRCARGGFDVTRFQRSAVSFVVHSDRPLTYSYLKG